MPFPVWLDGETSDGKTANRRWHRPHRAPRYRDDEVLSEGFLSTPPSGRVANISLQHRLRSNAAANNAQSTAGTIYLAHSRRRARLGRMLCVQESAVPNR